MPVTVKDISSETKQDLVLNTVVNYVLNGWPRKVNDTEIKPYFLCRSQLSFENGCLMRGHKVIIPQKLREKVLIDLHSSHLGIVKSKAEARSRFWFPGVDAAIERSIGSCHVCSQLRPSPPRVTLAPWKFPDRPFQRLHVDFLGPINGNMYLVVVDAFSKWLECFNMRSNITSVNVIDLDFKLNI